MTNELEKALADIIIKTTQGIGTAGDFILKEIPEVVQQLLVWHGVYNFVLFICGLIFTSIIIYVNKKQLEWILNKKINWDCWNGTPLLIMGNLFQIFLVGVIHILLYNLEWLKIWVAPKVWLIEYATKIISK